MTIEDRIALAFRAAMTEVFWTVEDELRDSFQMSVATAKAAQAWQRELDGRIREGLRVAFETAARSVSPDVSAEGAWEQHWSAVRPLLLDWPNQVLARAQTAVDTARAEGRSLAGIWEYVDDVLGDGPEEWRVGRMAQTEGLSAHYAGRAVGAQLAQVESLRWVTQHDGEVRPSHALLDGTEVPAGGTWDVGGFAARHPLDPALPADERVNCRCILSLDTALTADGGTVTTPALPSTTPGTDPVFSQPPNGWRGVLAPLDTMSSDGRMIAKVGDAPRTRPLPMEMGWVQERQGGHQGAVTAARIDRVWYEETDGRWNLMGEGAFDTSPDGIELARRVHEGFAAGVSVDLSELVAEWYFVLPDGTRAPEPESWEDFLELMAAGATEVMLATDWQLGSTTFVSIPAFGEARVEGVYGYTPTAAVVDLVEAGSITAAGGPMPGEAVYAAEAFDDPHLDGPTPVTIESDGRVYGHVGLWSSCHIGFADVCRRPPNSRTGYAAFHVGEALTDKGRLPVGRLTVGGGHAAPDLGVVATLAHYDDVASQVAIVRAGEDKHGIWVAGHIISGTHPDLVSALRRSPLSGDWRAVNGNLELVAAHAVNVPGFGVPRSMAASVGEHQVSLVAAGPPPRRGPAKDRLSVASIAKQVARELRREEKAEQQAQVLAARVNKQRVADLAARVGIKEES